MPTKTHPGQAALAIGLFVVLTTTAITYLLPEFYASSVRLQVERAGAMADRLVESAALSDLLYSPPVIAKVIEDLDLNRKWAVRSGETAPLDTQETSRRLKRSMSIRPHGNAGLFEVTVQSEDRAEAALIANKLGDALCEVGRPAQTGFRAAIVDRAEPGLRPVSPNIPLNLGAGTVLGAGLGALAFLIVKSLGRRSK